MREISEIIRQLREEGHFYLQEEAREDYVATRTSWDDLADKYDILYEAIMQIESKTK